MEMVIPASLSYSTDRLQVQPIIRIAEGKNPIRQNVWQRGQRNRLRWEREAKKRTLEVLKSHLPTKNVFVTEKDHPYPKNTRVHAPKKINNVLSFLASREKKGRGTLSILLQDEDNNVLDEKDYKGMCNSLDHDFANDDLELQNRKKFKWALKHRVFANEAEVMALRHQHRHEDFQASVKKWQSKYFRERAGKIEREIGETLDIMYSRFFESDSSSENSEVEHPDLDN